MRINPDDMWFSELADGELPSDQVNDLLMRTLDDRDARGRLKEMIRLRQCLRVCRQAASRRRARAN